MSWPRSGLRGDLSHALLWAGRLPPAAFLLPSRAGLYLWDQGRVPEPGTPGEGWLHVELNSLSL